MTRASLIRIRGVVQGVGYRPFVYRLAHMVGISGWVLNGEDGVVIHAEGSEAQLERFLTALDASAPPASSVASIDVAPTHASGRIGFDIRGSTGAGSPTARISPDLAVCEQCLAELFCAGDSRSRYPYINCTDCGPRYTIILGLPYDRPRTTMNRWPLCPECHRQYHDPLDRRFHAQPVACPECGPHYALVEGARRVEGDEAAVAEAAALLRRGRIVAVKGLGGFHLACNAADGAAVGALRTRKYRKEQPFAVMARDVEVARTLVELTPDGERALASTARPIVLAPARTRLAGVAPDNLDLGVMLPNTPLHHLIFDAGAPETLVMTSANRSSEPIAYRDDDALSRLAGIADAFLVGERPIARRVDDSVVRVGPLGPAILRRARGYAPGAVARLPVGGPVLAVGADLKNAITLTVDGEAFVSQHIGDLAHYPAFEAFQETIRDLISMYEVDADEMLVAYDAHPQYVSSIHALTIPAKAKVPVQHHRAHVGSVLAEREAWDRKVVGIVFDGTGYGDDGAIWGGEVFVGSVVGGLERVGHLRTAQLPGGDAAARHPVQAAAGFLCDVEDLPDLTAPPFGFPPLYARACALVGRDVRTFPTTSVGRLFDSAAALLGFVREISFEGQAAIWLEHLARGAGPVAPYECPWVESRIDFRPLLSAVVGDRLRGRDRAEIARAFHGGLARAVAEAARTLCEAHGTNVVVLTGGVFQNALLMHDAVDALQAARLTVWSNRAVPVNDGGISLGQAALAASSVPAADRGVS